ncbi:antibiotic biosynthesis monooxygenase [Hoeflea sp. WL0058]|uniref:Antibiotic biosynthesis monooxygenase n=1 Tax=Flavimaribacter sediminis TaxID=2865987 RepID=A0AAE2ZMF5_9HYPH|nr:antibiotic biosynthesis monooxygenase [Flavimaribacter sediminis]MBW8639303.1 antibiotic biosynthesis monooxygenase [Flavimaribacter sediminis]
MYVVMNRFKVKSGSEEAFEEVWRNRESRLDELDGFIEFQLLRGPLNEEEGYTLFASHTIWESRENFVAWTKSEQFRRSHANAGQTKVSYLGHPQLETFETVEGTRLKSQKQSATV